MDSFFLDADTSQHKSNPKAAAWVGSWVRGEQKYVVAFKRLTRMSKICSQETARVILRIPKIGEEGFRLPAVTGRRNMNLSSLKIKEPLQVDSQ